MKRSRRLHGRRARAARALALALTFGALASPVPADELSGAEARLLDGLRLLRLPERPAVAELASELAPVAPAGLELLLSVLLSDAVPGEDGGPARRLGEPQRELVLALLQGLPADAVLVQLDRALGESESPLATLGALDVLGAVGGAGEIERFFHHATEGLETLPMARLEPTLERALPGLLVRSESCRDWVVARWRAIDESLLPGVVRAVGAAGHPDGLELMVELIELRDDLATDAMAQVSHLVPARSVALDLRLRELLRERLEQEGRAVRRGAIRALAELEDAASVPRWIDFLELSERGLRYDALWALRRLSGLKLTDDPADWRRWYEEERRWFTLELGRMVTILSGDDAVAAVDALRELSRHRLERALVARAIATGLTHPVPGVRRLACELLGQLGRSEARLELEMAAEDAEPAVREAALRALERLSRR